MFVSTYFENADKITFLKKNYEGIALKQRIILSPPMRSESCFIFKHGLSLKDQALIKVYEMILDTIDSKLYKNSIYARTFFLENLSKLPVSPIIKIKLREIFCQQDLTNQLCLSKYYAKSISDRYIEFYSPYLAVPFSIDFTSTFYLNLVAHVGESNLTSTIEIYSELFSSYIEKIILDYLENKSIEIFNSKYKDVFPLSMFKTYECIKKFDFNNFNYLSYTH